MNKQAFTFKKSAAVTTSGAFDEVDVSGVDELSVYLDITAVTGTSPTLDLTIEDSHDKVTWFTHTAFAQKVAAGKDVKRITNFGKFVRVNAIVGGATPSFTFSIMGVGRANL